MSRLTLIDASGFIWRAFHAYPPLTRPSDGHPVGAVYGYASMLWKLLGQSRATHIAAVFDKGRSTERLGVDPNYKANRGAPVDAIAVQFPLVRDATRAFGVKVIEDAGIEADDLIATYAERAFDRGWRVTIVSSDKDLLQLVRPPTQEGGGVSVYCPQKKAVMDDRIEATFGVTRPEQIPCAQGMIGDSVDNIPGVPKIGPKTAGMLLSVYGTLEATIAAACDPVKPWAGSALQRKNLVEHAENARMSRQLALLNRNIVLAEPVDSLEMAPREFVAIDAFMAKMEFVTLRSEIRAAFGPRVDMGEVA